MKILGIGYSGRTLDELVRLAQTLDAMVVDVRLSARSRVPHWNKGRLQEALGPSYLHLSALGNLNYKNGGPITINDYPTGRDQLAELSSRTILLMCVCKQPERCHRTTVLAKLAEEGFDVGEYADPQQPRQLLLL